jgi:hypothetical protein
MTDARDLLIRGSGKVIAHYRLLLAGARIQREQRQLDQLQDGLPRRSAA